MTDSTANTTTLASLTAHAASRHADKSAVVSATGEACSFAELDARVARTAAWLRRQGLQRGDRVTLWAPNDVDWVVAYYGVLRAGNTATAEQIIEHCRGQLAAYKLPRLVQFVADLPKTSTGKVLRRALTSLDTTDARQPSGSMP